MEMTPSFSLNDLALKIDGIDAKIDALNPKYEH